MAFIIIDLPVFNIIIVLLISITIVVISTLRRRQQQQQQQSSSSQSRILIYDVFLSFRGKDTRRGFTKDLHNALNKKGINAFMDDSLQIGIDISQQLLTTIEQSRFAIVILSQNYASSRWCLKELLHIINSKKVVVPVFYDVEPGVVRHQIGSIREGLEESARYVTEVEVNQWRGALTTVANLSGYDVKAEFRYQGEVIKSIARKISNLLKNYEILGGGNDLVGISPRVERLKSCLALESNDDVRFIGIWGMIGSGKTTIAGELLRKIHSQFFACCFVEGIREKGEDALPQLRRDFFKKLLDEDENILNNIEGLSILSRLKNRKVLIILDDVSNENQIENFIGAAKHVKYYFGLGSRIILTTRDKHLTKFYCVPNEDCIYEVEKLNNAEAVELLRQKAFSEHHHPYKDNYNVVLEDIARYTSGLPGVIRVLGKDVLYAREVEIWEEVVQQLRVRPIDEIIEPFQAFIDKLDRNTKDMFLDIACFFNGNDEDYVKNIFESCGFLYRLGFNVLTEKSLITIEEQNLMMPTLLQQIGWHIVRKRHPNNPGKHSRLWLHEDASTLLANSLGTTNVEGIFLTLTKHERLPLAADSFNNMPNLRLLKISNVNFTGCLDYLSNKLRVLNWYRCPLQSMPSSFQPVHLVELHMPNSNIRKLFSGRFNMNNLRHINLSYCERLTKSPNFEFTPKLEILVLEGCTRLGNIHLSIRQLHYLSKLNLKACNGLLSLPRLNHLGSLKDHDYIRP